MNKLIGISGKLGSGKDTVANLLQYYDWKMFNDDSFNVPTAIEYLDAIRSFNDSAFGGDWTEYTRSSYDIRKFADKLKDIVCILIGCTREQLEDREFKEQILGEEWWYWQSYDGSVQMLPYLQRKTKPGKDWLLISHSPRTLLQLLGTEAGRRIIHPDIWVNALFADYISPPDSHSVTRWDPSYWIITDVRFPNEAEAIQRHGGIVIRVNRPTEERVANYWGRYMKESGADDWEEWLKKEELYSIIYHDSETGLDHYQKFDHVIENHGSLEDLYEEIEKIWSLNSK